MKHNDLTDRHLGVLHMMHDLPKRVLGVHQRDNGAEFVLHQLCHEDHFNVGRAAYFVDNPDFHCLKGIAGYNQEETFGEWETMWQRPQEFTLFMASSPFNQRVRAILREHLNKDENPEDMVAHLAQELGMSNPAFCIWDLKHENHGYLVYERSSEHDPLMNQFFTSSLHILSFCPIF